MITALLYMKDSNIVGFEVSGHAGYAEEGSDIVCAAVSAMVGLVSNTLSDQFLEDPQVRVYGETVSVRLSAPSKHAGQLLSAFYRELIELSGQYPNNLLVKRKKINE